MLILACIYCYIFTVRGLNGILHTMVGPVQVVEYFKTMSAPDSKSLVELMQTFFYANFCTFNMIHMGLSLYFFWVFAALIEAVWGLVVILFLTILGLTLPWLVLQFDGASAPDVHFFGPLFILCTYVGAYFVFPPLPPKKYGRGIMIKRRDEIFNKSEKSDPRAKWIKNPWMFVAVFVVAEAVFHIWVTMGLINPLPS